MSFISINPKLKEYISMVKTTLTSLKRSLVDLCLVLCISSIAFGQAKREVPDELLAKNRTRPIGALNKILNIPQQAVGILDKGRMLNVVSNFGVISNYHLFNPAIQWPGSSNPSQQYSFGVDFMVGVKGDVVESIYDQAIGTREFDWTPFAANLFSGDVKAADGTPLLATSSDTLTWPKNSKGTHFWPGPFRISDPVTGKQEKGVFVSDGDVYAVFNDSLNSNGRHGLQVQQMAYSFNRPFSRDFLIFDYKIQNTSAATIDSVFIGFSVDLKVDFDTHDIMKRYTKNGVDLFYEYDADGIPRPPFDFVGHIGVAALPTPNSKMFTDFHFFDNENSPVQDKDLWNILISDTNGFSKTDRGKYFHGSNRHFDNVSLSAALDPKGQNQGTDVVYIVSSGPHSIKSNDTLRLTFIIIAGEDEPTIQKNFDFAIDIAKKEFMTSTAPATPSLTAFAGDGRVTLVIDSVSEYSVDGLTGNRDFQGYKIYRSNDLGLTWGKSITDGRGTVVDYVPIAQFDLIDTIAGTDPSTGSYLGNNSGLKHMFVDSLVLNGIEYWYTVSAYDNGYDNNPRGSLSTPRGLSPGSGKQIQSVVPGKRPTDLSYTIDPSLNNLTPSQGMSDGLVKVQIIDPTKLTGLEYTITFNENDTVAVSGAKPLNNITTYNLTDSKGKVLLSHKPAAKSENDFIPVTDGIRVIAIDSKPGRKYTGWTRVQDTASTFDWYYIQKDRIQGTYDAIVWGIADFRITIDRQNTDSCMVDDQFGQTHGLKMLPPFKVHDITDPNNPVDVTPYTTLWDYEYSGLFPPNTYFGPKGWDLIPGGKGYNPFGEKYPDEFLFMSCPLLNSKLPDTSWVSMKTQNRPDEIPPKNGDQYTILTAKPFSKDVKYKFTVSSIQYGSANNTDVDLSKIKVVPNPLIVSTGFGADGKQIMFNNLPKQCSISIFSVAGDKIIKLDHNNITGYEYWDARNAEGRYVSFGLYVFIVETPNGQKQTGKFVIIR
jgi:hypothetical protein